MIVGAILLSLAPFTIADAQIATVSTDDSSGFTTEAAAIAINDRVVCETCAFYLSSDGNVFLKRIDVDRFGLKRPQNSSLPDGADVFGLAEDLRLASSYDERRHRLSIVAPPDAFRGAQRVGEEVSPGSGAFLNYKQRRESGQYAFNVASSRGGLFETTYVSTSGEGGLQFRRGSTKWSRVDARSHTLLTVGDSATDGAGLGSAVPFAGVHYATDYSSDPEFSPRRPPAVTGIATEPALLEVYVNNLLEVRRDIPSGPFTVTDLPSSAATGDVVVVLTGAHQNTSYNVVRPDIDYTMLGRNSSTFRFDAGVAHDFINESGAQYSGFIAQGAYRHGITDRLTVELLGERVRRNAFASVGLDMYVNRSQRLTLRAGSGTERNASELKYELTSGSVRLTESLFLNSQARPDFWGVDEGRVAQISEQSTLEFPLGAKIFSTVKFNRYRSNTGSDGSTASARIRYQGKRFELELSPTYAFARHALSANIALALRLRAGNRVALGASQTPYETSGRIRLRHERMSINDPLQGSLLYASGVDQTRSAELRYEPSWMTADASIEQLDGKTIVEPEVSGALALGGGHLVALQTVDERESFGILVSPLSVAAAVYLNGTEIGIVGAHSRMVVRDLLPYRQNSVRLFPPTAHGEGTPLAATTFVPVAWAPMHITPVATTP